MPINRFIQIICLLVAGSSAAHAVPVQWDVDGVLLEGGSITGSFIYDADASIFEDINLLSPSRTYNHFLGESFREISFGTTPTPRSGDVLLSLEFRLDELTNAGGTLTREFGSSPIAEGRCSRFSGTRCTSLGRINGWESRSTLTLTGTLVDVAEPSSLALFFLGLFGLVWQRVKKRV